VVVDNTNPGPEERAALLALGQSAGACRVAYYFLPDPAACWARNVLRPGRANVPERAFRRTLGRLVAPTRAEGFELIYRVRLEPGGFAVEAAEATDETR
jgi:hypothetical protein